MTAPVLELQDVSAAYSTYRALFGVSLTVPANGIVALVGSNGAGKSTLARVASGLVPASSGTIRVDGEDVTTLAAHRIARLGVVHVPEGRAVFSSLTVEENLTLAFLRRVGRRGMADALGRAYEAFPVLSERRRQTGGTLSGGQQRILSLAKVLAVPPKLLIVDELSLGLAPVIVDQVYDGLVAIHRQGSAVLVVEQQVDRALAIADRAVLLVKGAVSWEGSAAEAKPVLEAGIFGGHQSNGSSPPATNGSRDAAGVPYVAPRTTPTGAGAGAGAGPGSAGGAPPAPPAPPAPSWAPTGGDARFRPPGAGWPASGTPPPAGPGTPAPPPGAPFGAPGTPQGASGPPAGRAPRPDKPTPPSDLWIVGPPFPGQQN